MTTPRGRLTSVRRSAESGIVAVWTGILAIVIFGIGAFAIDVAAWYVEGERLQKAVDSAATSGVIYLPKSPATAESTARDIAQSNGWVIDDVETTFNAEQLEERPTQLRVTMSSEVKNTLGALLGVTTTRITRTAVADFAGPVPLGSPCNVFGRQDMEGEITGGYQVPETNCIGNELYWMNIAGENTNKARGDGYASRYCTKADATDGGIDECEGGPTYTAGSWTTDNENLDWVAEGQDGYIYLIKPLVDGDIRLQIYDLGWVAVGDNCTQGIMSNNDILGDTNPFVDTTAESNARYQRGNTTFCSGDTEMTGPEGDSGASGRVITTVTVREPSPNPWQPLDGAPLDLVGGTCEDVDVGGWRPNVSKAALDEGSDDYDEQLARTFHRWMDPCAQSGTAVGEESIASATGDYLTIENAVAGDEYSLQIKTRNGGGQNRFAIRALVDTGAGLSDQIQLFASGRVSLFNNVPAGTSTFNVVRLDSSTAGKILNLRFYDLGDATAPVTATLLQPGDATVTLTSGGVDVVTPTNEDQPFGAPLFSECSGAPTDPVPGTLTGCSVTTTKATNGGKWQTVAVRLPTSYRCTDDAAPDTCWVRIRLTTGSGQADTTTWSAFLDGDPVRLTQ